MQIETVLDKHKPKFLAFDGNLSSATIAELLRSQLAKSPNLQTFFEPTSTFKALRILPFLEHQAAIGASKQLKVTHVTPNRLELEALWQSAKDRNLLCMS